MIKNKNEHYVENKVFSQAIIDYKETCKKAIEEGKPEPNVSNYIGDCFLRICNKLAKRGNFYQYSFRDEMVLDAVENCMKAVKSFDPEKAMKPGMTRNGTVKTQRLNAFSYFTQIAWYAFVRRIQKEEKQYLTKLLYMEYAGNSQFADFNDSESGDGMIHKMRSRNDALDNNSEKMLKLFEKNKKKLIDQKLQGRKAKEDRFEDFYAEE
jgi:hypothetical protein